MADATNCNLASYGYDYVFAATQASMNSDMKAYLSNAPLTFNYYCFLAVCNTYPQCRHHHYSFQLTDLF